MAYGLKYELLCKSKSANSYELKLLFDGYTDADIDRNMPLEQPLVLKKDKASVVRGTSLDFGIREEVDFELDEFYTNNPKKIKAELYKDTTLLWTGYVLPQQYQAPYVPAPLTVRFTATDGLGLLKNESFTLTGRNSELAIIKHCVDKISLGLGYSIAVNLFETTHSHSAAVLAQTYQDAEIYAENNCYEALEKILEKYDAEITQLNGRWHITCSADKKSTRMLYTSAGAYDTTAAAPAVLDLGYPDMAGIEVWPVGSLGRSLEPGGKKVIIKHDFGRKDSMLTVRNYDFAEFAAGAFTGWTQSGTFTLEQRFLNGKPYAYLDGGNADGTQKIYREIEVDASTDDFIFQIDYAPVGKNTATGIRTILMTVRFQVTLTAGATTYYLTDAGEWTLTPTIISSQVRSSISSPVWNKLKVVAEDLPDAGTLRVSLFRYNNDETPETGDVFTGIAFSNPYTYFTSSGQLYPSGLETLAIFDNSTEPDDLGTIEVSAADAPDVFNKSIIYNNITRVSDGTPTELWHRLGSGSEYTLIVQLARTLASRSRIARQKLTGTIKGNGISFGSIIKHTYNSSREFEIAEGSWDMYNDTWIVTLLELLAWSDETITFTSSQENAATNGQSASSQPLGVVSGNDSGSSLQGYFELVDEGSATEHLRCIKPLSSLFDIWAFDGDGVVPDIWDDLPIASATVLGGIKVGANLAIDIDGVLNAEGGGGGDVVSGFASNYLFCDDVIFGGTSPVWHELERQSDGGTIGSHTATGTSYSEMDRYVTAALNTTVIPAGNWTFILYAKVSAHSGMLKAAIYRVNSAGAIVGSVLGTAQTSLFSNTLTTGIPCSVYIGEQTGWSVTDRIGVVISGLRSGGSATVTFYHDASSGWASFMTTPITLLHNQMNGLNLGDYVHLTATQASHITNWDTAYGWGNWASNFGTALGKICQGNDSRVNNGQTAYGWGNHASAGYAVKSNNETISGAWNMNGAVAYGGGNYSLKITTGDLWNADGIWHTFGNDADSYISWEGDQALTFNIDTHDKYFMFRGQDSGGTLRNVIMGYPSNTVELYYNGSKKVETTSTGVKATGSVVATGDVIAYG